MMIDLRKFSGKWFEVARLDTDFQPNMTNVTAEYILNNNGTITVINSGFLDGQLKQIIGNAITTEEDDLLKVSFYPGVYSDYKILAIDKNYQYALIAGEDKKFLWMLSRTPYINKDIYSKFIDIANKNEFDTTKLIINEQINYKIWQQIKSKKLTHMF